MPAGFASADAQAIGDAALVLMPDTPRARSFWTPRDETRLVDSGHMTQAIRSMVEPIRWLPNSRFRPAWVPGMQP